MPQLAKDLIFFIDFLYLTHYEKLFKFYFKYYDEHTADDKFVWFNSYKEADEFIIAKILRMGKFFKKLSLLPCDVHLTNIPRFMSIFDELNNDEILAISAALFYTKAALYINPYIADILGDEVYPDLYKALSELIPHVIKNSEDIEPNIFKVAQESASRYIISGKI